ncbi:hypothetical protein OHB26_02115 [Nocardia sp. NBC_01503]|uniref:hypothetical protein n=1 Tax=Nocardia sp. NBC_01503 TaxID=2975997 RepID=UPI002E7B45E4|nr:hypothetical protein [Nocardia sp. NBC_01503]WTL33073.1 hypothetical protein OHB26_02115 [Nocardia sp. NBC_01503]
MPRRFAGLCGATVATTSMLALAAPHASATVNTLSVSHESYQTPGTFVLDAFTDDVAPVWFLDNGAPISGSPLTPKRITDETSPCPSSCWVGMTWYPKTLGSHHLVAEQRAANGSVLSSRAKDIDVTTLPSSGSSNLLTGSAG